MTSVQKILDRNQPLGERKNKDILIVDDDESIVVMVTQLLAFEGYSSRFALNGERALEEIYLRKPDLILLDLMMPGISGYDVCRELKTRREYNSIPIIMLTAKKGRDNMLAGLRVGANNYITKPFDVDLLLDAIAEQLESSRILLETDGVECHARFEISSDFIYIKQVNELITHMFHQTKLTNDEIAEFEYCLNEALMNAIEHGSRLDPTKVIHVSYLLKKDRLIIEIEDEGTGFDFTCVPDPTTAENIFSHRGRGIFIMKKYMDDVTYNDKGTKITLIKHFH